MDEPRRRSLPAAALGHAGFHPETTGRSVDEGGYTGGDVANATYRNHGTHAEAIEIVFDLEQISYRDLLAFFFQIHDPTTRNRQGNDVDASYRSAIFISTRNSAEWPRTRSPTLMRRASGPGRSPR